MTLGLAFYCSNVQHCTLHGNHVFSFHKRNRTACHRCNKCEQKLSVPVYVSEAMLHLAWEQKTCTVQLYRISILLYSELI